MAMNASGSCGYMRSGGRGHSAESAGRVSKSWAGVSSLSAVVVSKSWSRHDSDADERTDDPTEHTADPEA